MQVRYGLLLAFSILRFSTLANSFAVLTFSILRNHAFPTSHFHPWVSSTCTFIAPPPVLRRDAFLGTHSTASKQDCKSIIHFTLLSKQPIRHCYATLFQRIQSKPVETAKAGILTWRMSFLFTNRVKVLEAFLLNRTRRALEITDFLVTIFCCSMFFHES